MPTATSSISPRVPLTVCWPVPVPSQLTVIAVSGFSPPVTNCSATATISSDGTVRTSSPGACARASKSMPPSSVITASVWTPPTGTPA